MIRPIRLAVLVTVASSAMLCGSGDAHATGGLTERVSVSSSGEEANNHSIGGFVSVSADGRYVAFLSLASNLVAGDTNGFQDAFVRDRLTGQTERISIDSSGNQANQASTNFIAISADGRYVAFASPASNLVIDDTNTVWDIFVHDRQSGDTERVSVDSAESQGSSGEGLAISGDGRYVAFESAHQFVPEDTNVGIDIYVRDRQQGTTTLVSRHLTPSVQDDGDSSRPDISADGRFVVFVSTASDLVPVDTNGATDIFIYDLTDTAPPEIVTLDGNGLPLDSGPGTPKVSADGRFVAFDSGASTLVAGDTNGSSDVFVRDTQLNQNERVSVDNAGSQGNNQSGISAISDDGRYVTFMSFASNLVPGDTNGGADVFVRDRQLSETLRVSVNADGEQASPGGTYPDLSANGRVVGFSTTSPMVPNDSNGYSDIYIRDLDGVDSDADGVSETLDNCPALANPSQENNDGVSGTWGGTQSWIIDGSSPEGQHTGGDACDANDDNDLSCTDVEEAGGNINLGGTRNALNPWDFADVPTPALPMAGAARNGAVSLADVGAALSWVGRVNNGPPDTSGHDYDDDTNANGVEDGAEYDRTPAGMPLGTLSGPPNGAISLQDVGVILNQVGDSCTAAPN